MSEHKPPSISAEMTSAALELDLRASLVCEAQQGSRSAADLLVRENDGWLRGVIYGVTGRPDLVDDIAQQVWTQVWERLPTLKDPRRLRSWLYTVARNAAIDAGQARRRRAAVGIDQLGDGVTDQRRRRAERSLAGDEMHGVLLRAVQSLPALYREPFVLRHLENWSYAEIGELLGLPVETVETRLVRARRHLREALKDIIER
ncbi:MAG: RNA polymerase sigma factor [Planctomycetota bacterium]|nr:MAG: RNA polymerase sigma factor [Planctomycetota bacterium]